MGPGFSVERIAEGLNQPVFATEAPGREGLFVVERGGTIRILDPETGEPRGTPFLDVSDEISTAGERGLLGLAFSPDFESSGNFYVHLSNPDGDTEIRRYTVSSGEPERADPASGDVIFTTPQPFSNHNGGFLGFGPDGFLRLALGDGGGPTASDPGNPGQDPDSPLGSILRLDVRGDDFPDDPRRDYAIPADNPFAGGGGAPEIWAMGLRNPFRAGFDPATGDFYIGDVGEGSLEEVDAIPRGQGGLNFGWNAFEGTESFFQGADVPEGASPMPPVLEYPHGGGARAGNSVTGGVVYRGPIEELDGEYVFGDFVSGNLWSVAVDDLAVGGGEAGDTLRAEELTVRNDDLAADQGGIDLISGFAQDRAGNLFVTDLDGELFRVSSNAGPEGGDLDLLQDFTVSQQLAALYVGYFGRAPDPAGLAFWRQEFSDARDTGRGPGEILEDVAESFRLGDEAQRLFPFLDPEAGRMDGTAIERFVTRVFENLFERAPDAAGETFWSDEIAGRLDAGVNIGDIVVDIAAGARDVSAADLDGDGQAETLNDATALGNKIQVADLYRSRIGDAFTLDSARAVVDAVGPDAASVTGGQAQIAGLAPGLPAVELF